MGKLGHVSSFRDLEVYRRSRTVAREIFELSKSFPRDEAYSLTDQVRRSSRAIGAQVAEAWAKRRYERHFVSKLTDGDAEQHETRHWVEVAADCGYVSRQEAVRLSEELGEIGRMLNGMIVKSASCCACGGAEALPDAPGGPVASAGEPKN